MQRKLAIFRMGVAGRRLGRPAWLGALVVVGALLAGCSSDSSGRGEGASGDPAAPYAGGGEGADPGATETNFFSIPCDEDADCGEGRCLRPDSGLPRCE